MSFSLGVPTAAREDFDAAVDDAEAQPQPIPAELEPLIARAKSLLKSAVPSLDAGETHLSGSASGRLAEPGFNSSIAIAVMGVGPPPAAAQEEPVAGEQPES